MPQPRPEILRRGKNLHSRRASPSARGVHPRRAARSFKGLEPDHRQQVLLSRHTVDEADLHGQARSCTSVASGQGRRRLIVPSAARLESEAELTRADAGNAQSMDPRNGPRHPRRSHRLLRATELFMPGPRKSALGNPVGAHPPRRGVIHTRFDGGFIRAEIYTLDWGDLSQSKPKRITWPPEDSRRRHKATS